MNTKNNIGIRTAVAADLEAIVGILNETILLPYTNGFTAPFTTKERIGWFEEHTDTQHPIYIAEIDNEIVGWLSISPYRQGRDAFRHTREVSYYIAQKYARKGVASALLQYAIGQAKELDAKIFIAILMDKNAASIGLLEKHGFEKWASLPDVAEIDGTAFTHLYYGRKLFQKR